MSKLIVTNDDGTINFHETMKNAKKREEELKHVLKTKPTYSK